MNRRFCSRKVFKLQLLILVLLSAYVFYHEIKTELISKWIQESLKLQERKKPVNNLTYPAFKHPLAPPYPFPYKFIINQPDKCKDRTPFLVLIVIVESHDIESRHTIRETWGNESIYDADVVKIFLVGIPKVAPDATQKLLEEESLAFGDIIQQDFMDTYYNLTLKTLMGMEWVTKFCPSVSYVMKIDNDMFLNVDYLVHQFLNPGLPIRNNYFTGAILANTGPFRSRAYKWYVPKEIYPNDTYPPYCSGPGYLFSVDMAKKIYDVAQEIRVIPMEDAFMGICLYELHIPPTAPPAGIFHGFRLEYDLCRFRKIVTVHHFAGKELRTVWADFWAKRNQKC
ncbi:beta-1,3-galactosyltransferase 2-like [Bufo gargarizans]|uniref:beta-1,3-galactosyltransferase 2-like n=1 Tax=Bufo gargarizans TaxID=30331 RepID=UPI001CF40977|nr:beta-1,3-galactosyltransferase 2-like [Bufo gargarizans]